MKRRQASIHTEEYQELVAKLVALRKRKGITQQTLARRIGFAQHDVSKVENCVRKLDVVELRDWMKGLGIGADMLALVAGALRD